MNDVQTGLKCKPNVKRCKRFVFAAHSPLLHPNTLTTKAISHFQADHILTRFVFPPLYDALAVVVHPSNPVKQLTRQQLEDIFRGKVTNWQQVGGDDRKIVVYSRETSSGTYEFFKESVLKNKNYMSSSLSMPATGAIIQSVSQTRGAIGYVGLAYVSPRIKTLAVSYDGQHYAAPTLENAINKTYPIVRPLYYYYNRKNASVVAPLLDFILSAAGQKIIKESGYIPVHKE